MIKVREEKKKTASKEKELKTNLKVIQGIEIERNKKKKRQDKRKKLLIKGEKEDGEEEGINAWVMRVRTTGCKTSI